MKGHLSETRSQLEHVESILRRHDAQGETHTDDSMEKLIRESKKWAEMVEDEDQRDAGLIASVQRIEHYEIAVYVTLAGWARQLGFDEDEDDLRSILEEERAADECLSVLAERDVNPAAA